MIKKLKPFILIAHKNYNMKQWKLWRSKSEISDRILKTCLNVKSTVIVLNMVHMVTTQYIAPTKHTAVRKHGFLIQISIKMHKFFLRYHYEPQYLNRHIVVQNCNIWRYTSQNKICKREISFTASDAKQFFWNASFWTNIMFSSLQCTFRLFWDLCPEVTQVCHVRR